MPPPEGPGTGTVAAATLTPRTASAIAPSSTQDRLRMSIGIRTGRRLRRRSVTELSTFVDEMTTSGHSGDPGPAGTVMAPETEELR